MYDLLVYSSTGLDFKENRSDLDYQGIKFSNPSKELMIHKITNLTWITTLQKLPSYINKKYLTIKVKH